MVLTWRVFRIIRYSDTCPVWCSLLCTNHRQLFHVCQFSSDTVAQRHRWSGSPRSSISSFLRSGLRCHSDITISSLYVLSHTPSESKLCPGKAGTKFTCWVLVLCVIVLAPQIISFPGKMHLDFCVVSRIHSILGFSLQRLDLNSALHLP